MGEDGGQGAVKDRPLIGAVGEQFPEKGKQTEQCRQQLEAAVAILNVGGGDDAVQQKALGIDQDMALLQIITGTLAQAVKIYQDAAAEREQLLEENRMLKAELRERYNFEGIVGNSPAIQAIFQTIVSVAPTRSTVLIRGESGTGKELIANAIHYNSPRAEGPFVRVNCAAIPEQLLEAELFGYRKGSFTGAISDRKGKFVVADGGTIFLDEPSA